MPSHRASRKALPVILSLLLILLAQAASIGSAGYPSPFQRPQGGVLGGSPSVSNDYTGGDIIDQNTTVSDVSIVQPLLVENSTVTFLNVSFENTTTIIDSSVTFINISYVSYTDPDEMTFSVLLNITGSDITFTSPLPKVPLMDPAMGVIPEVLVENSTIRFRDDFPEIGPPVPWPFSYSASNYLLFLGNFSIWAFDNQDTFYAYNTFEFWGDTAVGLFEVVGGTIITHSSCIRGDSRCEPYVLYDIRNIAYDDAFGDIRVLDVGYFEGHNITALDTVNVRDRSRAVFVDSRDVGAEVFGEARLTVINTTSSFAYVYNLARVEIYGGGVDTLSMGDRATGYLQNVSYFCFGVLTDDSLLKVEGGSGCEWGRVAATADSRLELYGHNGTGEFWAFGNSTVRLNNSYVRKLVLLDDATLILENSSVVEYLYYGVRVDGSAEMHPSYPGFISGSYRVPSIADDGTTTVLNREPLRIIVEEGGDLAVRDFSTDPPNRFEIYVYGSLRVNSSAVDKVLAYGRNSSVLIENSDVIALLRGVHVTGSATIDGGAVSGSASLQPILIVNSSVQEDLIGYVDAGKGARIGISNVTMDSLRIYGDAKVNLRDMVLRTVRIAGTAEVEARNVTYDTRWLFPIQVFPTTEEDFAKWTPVFSPTIKSDMEISGNADVRLYNANARSMEVFDNASLWEEYDEIWWIPDMFQVYGNARAVMRGGATFVIAFEEANVISHKRAAGFDVFVLDNATFTFQFSDTQDLWFGRKSGQRANGLALGIYRYEWNNPVSSFGSETDDPFVSGDVILVAWGVLDESRYDLATSRMLAPEVDIYVDDVQLTPRPDPWYWMFDWNTTDFKDGDHTITVVMGDGQGYQFVHKVVVTVFNNISAPVVTLSPSVPDQIEVFEEMTLRVDVTAYRPFTVSLNVTDPWGGFRGNFSMEALGDGVYEYSLTFDELGVFNLTVWAVDMAGDAGSYYLSLRVVDTTPPVADAGEPINATVGEEVTFDASGSTDNYRIVNYTWSFQVGEEMVVLHGPRPTYVFPLPGTYIVTLTVRDGGGNVDTAATTVFLEPAGILTPEMTLVIVGIAAAVLTLGVAYLFIRRRERRG